MSSMTVVIQHDVDTGIAEVTLAGPLNPHTASTARLTLMTCLAEHPDTILIDLSRLAIESETALSVLPSVARQAMDGIAIMPYVAASTRTGQILRRVVDRYLPVYEDRSAALAAALDHPARLARVHARLPAELGSVASARALARYACRRWALDDLAEDVQLIVSELVTNAIEHAGTLVDVTLLRRSAYLHIRVHDGSSLPPRFPIRAPGDPLQSARGRGVHLVTMLASGWGAQTEAHGKTVWATLRLKSAG
jgi:anti-sigma regulatory factor (Ser/Thr protein kinase)